jgi:hypothetical protein
MKPIWSLFMLAVVVSIAGHDPASAQANIEQQCRLVTGKAYRCCAEIVTKNPGIEQCAKEVAISRCLGNNKYVSPHGCKIPK